MPRYDYKCEGGHKYELTQPFNSPLEHACEKCGKPAHRVLVAPPLVFKASGYYKTADRGRDSDSSSSAGGSSARSSTPPKKLSDDSSPAATETKARRSERIKSAD
ncbi:MAG: FmdB family zinc ribbon protein [Dehalococcoidia bacterium]